jgi:hypothetical protein
MAKSSWISGIGLGSLAFGIGAGIGAGLMYWFDPDRGQRRRSIVRDKARRRIRSLERAVERTGREAGDRIQELAAAAKSSTENLADQVRSHLPAAVKPVNLGRPVAARIVTGAAGGALLVYGIASATNRGTSARNSPTLE